MRWGDSKSSRWVGADRGRLVVTNRGGHGHVPNRRITLTFSGIAQTRRGVVSLKGEVEAELLAAVRRRDPDVSAPRITADR